MGQFAHILRNIVRTPFILRSNIWHCDGARHMKITVLVTAYATSGIRPCCCMYMILVCLMYSERQSHIHEQQVLREMQAQYLGHIDMFSLEM